MATETASSGKVISRKEGGIGWLIFSNPQRRNAVSVDMTEAAAKIIPMA